MEFHFHSPAEHTVDGFQYGAELHLVHRRKDRADLTVLGVFFDPIWGEESEAASDFIESLQLEDMGKAKLQVSMKNFMESLSEENFFHYSGSLTTPPCSEGVNWFVYLEPR